MIRALVQTEVKRLVCTWPSGEEIWSMSCPFPAKRAKQLRAPDIRARNYLIGTCMTALAGGSRHSRQQSALNELLSSQLYGVPSVPTCSISISTPSNPRVIAMGGRLSRPRAADGLSELPKLASADASASGRRGRGIFTGRVSTYLRIPRIRRLAQRLKQCRRLSWLQ